MIQTTLKLKLRPTQERLLNRWIWHLTGLHNWVLRKIELDAKDGIYHGDYALMALLKGHSKRLGIPQWVMRGQVQRAHRSWQRCFKRLAGKPRMKGARNRLNGVDFPGVVKIAGNRATLLGIGRVGFHKRDIPAGRIKCGRILKRASGWYLCLSIDAEAEPIQAVAHGQIGIDPGFLSLLTLSSGEKIPHPHELQIAAERLAQAQRGSRRRLTARLQERIANQRRDRNHKLSHRLVAENKLIAFSDDRHSNIARTFGKSVASASHYQLRTMLADKSRTGGREYYEVSHRNSTRTCSVCGSLSGPTGWRGLSVREWVCTECGSEHDRDCNAAVNTLISGLGISLKRAGDGSSGIAR